MEMNAEEGFDDIELRHQGSGCGTSTITTAASTNDNNRPKSKVSLWHVFGSTVPRSEIVFSCQMIIILIVVLAAIYNLSISGERVELWTALLSSCLGYVLPNPQLRKR